MNSQFRNLARLSLPAILVFVVYWAIMGRSAALSNARHRRDTLQATSPPAEAVLAEEARVRQTDARLAKLKKDTAELELAWSKLSGRISPASASRARSLGQFSQMLWSNGLYEVERSPADNSDGHLPPSLNEMVRNISGNAGSSAAQLWNVKFYGRYQNVMALLDAIRTQDGSQSIILPVGLTMGETKPEAEGWRVWTLLLWM